MAAKSSEEKNYGFVINNRNCIGCHACSTACKSENDVPLGVYRTWVKYTEVGEHPQSRRQFQVTRCNHCANPPCVRICPVTAMYQRDDGIVEFDPEACIGCKACLQACPYDAIHIDPQSGTAAKCHYCAHRVEVGMEPSCVVVCPTHAIVAGDMNDPDSEISKVLAGERTTVRKPEQGTAPKLFYIEGDDITMHPTATERSPETFMWADVVEEAGRKDAPNKPNGHAPADSKRHADSGVALREPQSQGMPNNGPIQIGEGKSAGQMVQVAYNAQHKIPWHWQVPSYLVTKAIAAGVFLFLAMAWLGGLADFSAPVASAGSLATVGFLLATTGLLVGDLERPERFLSIVFRPQTKSWLAKGAFILMAFSALATGWAAVEVGSWLGFLDASLADSARPWLLGLGTPLAVGTAIYTAFLFGQAEGRDLWQSPLLPFHLLVQSGVAGAAAIAIMATFIELPAGMADLTMRVFVGLLALDLFVTLIGEFGMPHASEVAAQAAHEISHGKYKEHFWYGAILLGHVVPLLILVFGFPFAGLASGLLALVGLYLFEHAFVMAPQEIPNS
jgi:Fe-S-cluster-containing dehydrogenase component/formate-dependent nitrite reductase membrane component NrfD